MAPDSTSHEPPCTARPRADVFGAARRHHETTACRMSCAGKAQERMHRGVPTSLKSSKNRYVMLCSAQGLHPARPPWVSTSLADARENIRSSPRRSYIYGSMALLSRPKGGQRSARLAVSLVRSCLSAHRSPRSISRWEVLIAMQERAAGLCSCMSVARRRTKSRPKRRRQHNRVPHPILDGPWQTLGARRVPW